MYKLIIFFLIITNISIAQTPLLTDTIALPFIEIPKLKKTKKRALFFSVFKPNARRRDEKVHSNPYTIRPDNDTATYYQYQSLFKYKYHFEGTWGLSFGVSKDKKLQNNLNLKYGYGFSIFGITSSRTQDTLETTILKKYKLLSPGTPSVIEETVINKELGFDELIYFTYPRNHVVVSFFLPFGLEYKVSEKIYLGFDYTMSMPISAKSSGYVLNPSKKLIFTQDLESTYIARLLISCGLHFKYDIKDSFFVEANGTVGNLFNRQLVGRRDQLYGLYLTGLYTYGLKFGYYY